MNSQQINKETWTDAFFNFDSEFYHPELYDVFVDKMLHQYYGCKNPSQEGHSKYIQCPVCQHFMDNVKREYTSVDYLSTKFTITVYFPENTQLKIQVEEKHTKYNTIHVHFQVFIYMNHSYDIQLNQHPVPMQDFMKSWMNSLFVKLHEQSKKYQNKIEKYHSSELFEIYL